MVNTGIARQMDSPTAKPADMDRVQQQVHLGPEEAGNKTSPLRASTHPGCFVCGTQNPRGMQVRFHLRSTGEVDARWAPSLHLEGFRGIIHGGVVSTVLDEAMSKAVASLPCEALTAELRVRFREPVRSGSSMRIRGWVCQQTKRRIATEATLMDENGVECAQPGLCFCNCHVERAGVRRGASTPSPRPR